MRNVYISLVGTCTTSVKNNVYITIEMTNEPCIAFSSSFNIHQLSRIKVLIERGVAVVLVIVSGVLGDSPGTVSKSCNIKDPF